MQRPFLLRSIAVVSLVGAVGLSSSCTNGRTYCTKEAQCLEEDQDVTLESDSVAVCIAQYDGRIAALRANEEPECQVLADAVIAVDLCRAGLDCNDFFDANDVNDACEKQLDDLDDALEDVDDGRCSALES
jgi:hypothetical protein